MWVRSQNRAAARLLTPEYSHKWAYREVGTRLHRGCGCCA